MGPFFVVALLVLIVCLFGTLAKKEGDQTRYDQWVHDHLPQVLAGTQLPLVDSQRAVGAEWRSWRADGKITFAASGDGTQIRWVDVPTEGCTFIRTFLVSHSGEGDIGTHLDVLKNGSLIDSQAYGDMPCSAPDGRGEDFTFVFRPRRAGMTRKISDRADL